MSSFENNMEDRFSNFEPEIDESIIDQNWQKLKGRLPLEKENKAPKSFFISLPFALICLIIAISGTIVFIYFSEKTMLLHSKSENLSHNTTSNALTDNEIQNNKPQYNINSNYKNTTIANPPSSQNIELNSAILQKTALKNNDAKNEAPGLSKSISTQASFDYKIDIKKEKNTLNINSKSAIKIAANKTIDNTLSYKNKTSNSLIATKTQTNFKTTISSNNTENSEEQLLIGSRSSANSLNNPSQNQSIQTNFNQPEITKSKSNAANEFNQGYTIENLPLIENYLLPIDTQMYDLKQPVVFFENPDSIEIATIKQSKVSYDLFVGTNWAQNKLYSTLKNESFSSKNNKLGYSIGAAINYKLSSKLTTQGQFIFNQNNINSNTDANETILISKQTRLTVNPLDSSVSKDTLFKSLNYSHHYNLKSTYGYNFGLGLGYSILEKNKLFIDGFVLVNLKLSKYDIERISYLATDTNQYTSQSVLTSNNDTIPYSYYNSPPTTGMNLSHTIKNLSSSNVGITPGITIGYKINQRVSLIVKPSYYINITKSNVNFNDLMIRISQNNLFIHFGVKLKF